MLGDPAEVGSTDRGSHTGSELIPAACSTRLPRHTAGLGGYQPRSPPPRAAWCPVGTTGYSPRPDPLPTYLTAKGKGSWLEGPIRQDWKSVRVKASRQTSAVFATRPGGGGGARVVAAPCLRCLACATIKGDLRNGTRPACCQRPCALPPSPSTPAARLPDLSAVSQGGGGVKTRRLRGWVWPEPGSGCFPRDCGRGKHSGSEFIPAASSARLARPPCRPRRQSAAHSGPHNSLAPSRDPGLQPLPGPAADLPDGRREGLLAQGADQDLTKRRRLAPWPFLLPRERSAAGEDGAPARCELTQRRARAALPAASSVHPPAPGGRGAQWIRGHRLSARGRRTRRRRPAACGIQPVPAGRSRPPSQHLLAVHSS
ncbi:uncharacterized protein LOC121457687 [Microtus oregoni]|uniref:uncharacterized protein LOC121457687 n=1 Tax=Microtus oregoni TaxID=111838 RepID=UPI001BB24C30|nr:uncharacterized protein LOC121457687 [Microtus oregoni]